MGRGFGTGVGSELGGVVGSADGSALGADADDSDGSALGDGQGDGQCKERTDRFALIYTLGFTTSVWGSLPAGTIVDRYGSQASLMVSALLLGGGMLMIGFADSEELDIFVPG